MTMQRWKQRLMSGGLVLMAAVFIGGTQIAAAKLNDAGFEALGITEADYETARDEAKIAYNNELVAMGWISAEEAAEENEDGDWARIGRGQYYHVLDKDLFIADALGVSLAELQSAEDASFDAKLAEKVADGDLTEAEAADKEAIHDFKESIDKDSILAQALGISVSELNAARAANTEFSDLLDDLGLTRGEVRDAEQAIMAELVQDAVEDGTLTAEQAEQLQNGRSGRGRGRGRGGRGGNGNGNNPPPPPTDDA